MKSNIIKDGQRGTGKSPSYGIGYTKEEIDRPLIGIVNAHNEIIAGHMHLDRIAQAAKIGVAMAGGTLYRIPAIGICDGIAMGHQG